MQLMNSFINCIFWSLVLWFGMFTPLPEEFNFFFTKSKGSDVILAANAPAAAVAIGTKGKKPPF